MFHFIYVDSSPGIGNSTAKLSTFSLSSLILSWNTSWCIVSLKSFKVGPLEALLISTANLNPFKIESIKLNQ